MTATQSRRSATTFASAFQMSRIWGEAYRCARTFEIVLTRRLSPTADL
jgi:hypothetical protein